MLAVFDLETSITWKQDIKGKTYSDIGSPFNNNKIVVIGFYTKEQGYKEVWYPTLEQLEKLFEGVTTVVGHNLKYDLGWLRRMGMDTSRFKTYDTMLVEYALSCSTADTFKVGLGRVAPKYGGTEKIDIIKHWWEHEVNTIDIPQSILSAYVRNDVRNTWIVYNNQKDLSGVKSQAKYIRFLHDMMPVVQEMEYNGLKFNDKAKAELESGLHEVRERARNDFIAQIQEAAGEHFDSLCQAIKGDIVDSPAALSKLVYSLEIRKDKKAEFKEFASKFRPHRRGAQTQLDKAIADYCEPLPYGLGVKPNVGWMSEAQPPKGVYVGGTGFVANAKMMKPYMDSPQATKKQIEFLKAMVVYSKADTAITSGYCGILKGLRADGFVHGHINQTGTVTTRFSSSEPNLQNFGREDTSPIKKAFSSRFTDGLIVSADFAQLEFRVCGVMANERQLIKDVSENFDIHSHSAKMAFGDKFEKADDKERKKLRTAAKSVTFAFQYGAMPKNKTQQAIFDAFYGKYKGIAAWQAEVEVAIINNQRYVCPFTGKIFVFPFATDANRNSWLTKAKNYPVQYLSAVVAQLATLNVYEAIKDRSDMKLLLQVHDSIVLDVKADKLEEAKAILSDKMQNISPVFERYFGHKLDVDFKVDIGYGATYYDC
jgi:DNA polymerase I-like protein with 3'-5' exonuclease and polymerase domains